MSGPVAVVGMACRYPDADSPERLWEVVLAGRRAFRRLPAERLRLEDYWSPDPAAPDRLYATQAAVLDGWVFDRVGFTVAGSTFRTTDPAHWLALEVATAALDDAGFAGGDGLPRASTGVVVGNTLTGDVSRANSLRLRWPYVRRTVAAELAAEGWDADRLAAFLDRLEATYKRPFAPVDEDTLAGGLSNTIAGRICNHLDLGGGGWTVDGACASSLLAVVTACRSLLTGDLDVAVAGGVDLSLDPFELVGFAKTGALAARDMRVYDRASSGFWPGEGCGMVVLMRADDARAQGRRIHALLRGWGVSSDGHGGITRPEAGGQRRAIERAYRQAGIGIEQVAYFEGHGTGTSVGDATELRTLTAVRRAAGTAPPAAIGSIKANIGHTKAAAGVAGLIKATLAVREGVIPPTTGCLDPHPELAGPQAALRVPDTAEPWPAGPSGRRVAGVSAMGFGGINTHVVVEAPAGDPATGAHRPAGLTPRVRALASTPQDRELFLLDAADPAALRARVAELAAAAPRLSLAELTDLAAHLAGGLTGGPARAAVVAATPAELAGRLDHLLDLLDRGLRAVADPVDGTFLGLASPGRRPNIVLLFPGQGSWSGGDGRALRRRFPAAAAVYERLGHVLGKPPPRADGGAVDTAAAQPAIAAACLAGLRALDELGIEATAAVGHSLGELAALRWAGAMDDDALLRIAAARGRAMQALSLPGGAMASLGTDQAGAAALLDGDPVVIAGLNGPRQTVIAGPAAAVDAVVARAARRGVQTAKLPVSHAFHSPLVAPAATALALHLMGESLLPPRCQVVSTVTGAPLPPDADLAVLLCEQITAPVRFAEAVTRAADGADLLIETGPGRVLTGLVGQLTSVPAVALETDGRSLAGLLRAAGAAFVLGAPLRAEALFSGRFARPIRLDRPHRFLPNPCEQAPTQPDHHANDGRDGRTVAGHAMNGHTADHVTNGHADGRTVDGHAADGRATDGRAAHDQATGDRGAGGLDTGRAGAQAGAGEEPLDLLRRLVAERAELPPSAVGDDSLLLDDLHLSSITVGQILVEACQALGLAPPAAPSGLATSTLAELAGMLDELRAAGGQAAEPPTAEGVAAWARAFSVELVEAPPPPAPAGGSAPGRWSVYAPDGHPLAAPLRAALEAAGCGDGVLACLPPDCDERHAGLLLAAAKAAKAASPRREPVRFVLVQHGAGAASLAKTLRLEAPWVITCVVDTPMIPEAVPWVVAEAAAATGFTEARYDAAGTRRVPVLRPVRLTDPCAADPGAKGSGAKGSGAGGAGTADPGTADLGAADQGTEDPGARPGAAPGAGPGAVPLGAGDVLLATGGGKGIVAECALDLAITSGASLLLLGRADPAGDPELAANLARFDAAGVTYRYAAADVTDEAAVRRAVAECEAKLGPVTAVLHGAGTNTPRLLEDLDEAALLRTLAPKVAGLRAVLAAVDPARLRLLVTFGSVIGRAGLRGEADYALANEWLTELTGRVAAERPDCRCLAIEWSAWAGAGMAERLGRVDALLREGVTAIRVPDGIEVLRRLLATPDAPSTVVVTGRIDTRGTFTFECPELPLLRFLERPLVHYPGVELVVEAEVSPATDPYVDDHLVDGERLVPAVIGLEAMAQVAAALLGLDGGAAGAGEAAALPVFEAVAFDRPLTIPRGGTATLRVAALADHDQRAVRVVVRSDQTGFLTDHFRATCRFDQPARAGTAPAPAAPAPAASVLAAPAPAAPATDLPPVALDPRRELYGGLLFQAGRFRRLAGYRWLRATGCQAEIATSAPAGAGPWFAPWLPAGLLLGDPGTRDAYLHAIQACVPTATLLPAGVDRILPGVAAPGTERVVLHARERHRDGDVFTYDLEVAAADGTVIERWEGLRLVAVRHHDSRGPWVPGLLGPWLERRVAELAGELAGQPAGGGRAGAEPATAVGRATATAVATATARATWPVAVEAALDDRPAWRSGTALAAGDALVGRAGARQRPGGGSDLGGGEHVSGASAAGLALAVAGPAGVTCDLEPVTARGRAAWEGLLNESLDLAERLAREHDPDLDVAGTRVRAALKCGVKAGRPPCAPLTLAARSADGWVLLRSGGALVATVVTTVRGVDGPVAVALGWTEDTRS